MSLQRLSDRKTRHVSEVTNLDVIRAWTSGSAAEYTFVTRDHQHGTLNHKSGEWHINSEPTHVSTCNLIDPTEPTGYRPE